MVHLGDAHLVVPPDAGDRAAARASASPSGSARRPAAGPAPATRSTCDHLRRPRARQSRIGTAGCPLRSAGVSARAGGARDRVPGPDPDAQPQRLPAALGRRGHPVRPGRGHPAPADPGRRAGHGDHRHLHHPRPRRPLPGPARRAAADVPGRGRPPRPPDLPPRRGGVRRPAAPRVVVRRPAGGGALSHLGRRAHPDVGAPDPGVGRAGAPAADGRLPPGRGRRPHDGARAARRARAWPARTSAGCCGRGGWSPSRGGSRSRRSAGPAPGSGSRSSWTPPCATARAGWPSARTCSCARRRTPRPTASWPRRTGTSRPATPAGSPPTDMPGGWSSRTSPSATPNLDPLLAEARLGARGRRPGPRPRPGAGARPAAPGSRAPMSSSGTHGLSHDGPDGSPRSEGDLL